MTAIWRNDGSGWELASPVGFPNEEKLHDLIEEAPQVLPLAGSPRLVVLGREVRCGSGLADLIAVERTGRPVLIEIKLEENSEARRAVVAQLLSYAAAMRGLTLSDFNSLVAAHLPDGIDTAVDAVAAADQEGDFDAETFDSTLAECLSTGRFRLVFVLDSTPADLVRLVGYLEDMTDAGLAIDLVTMSQYQAGGSRLLVPQRVEPGRGQELSSSPVRTSTVKAVTTEGSAEFLASIRALPSQDQPTLDRLANWAADLERDGLVRLFSTRGTSGRTTLVPRLNGYDAGLVTVVNEHAGAALWLWRSVMEKSAPHSLTTIEAALGTKVLQGSTTHNFEDEILAALREAHREAASGVA
jgi:hypothetical protein